MSGNRKGDREPLCYLFSYQFSGGTTMGNYLIVCSEARVSKYIRASIIRARRPGFWYLEPSKIELRVLREQRGPEIAVRNGFLAIHLPEKAFRESLPRSASASWSALDVSTEELFFAEKNRPFDYLSWGIDSTGRLRYIMELVGFEGPVGVEARHAAIRFIGDDEIPYVEVSDAKTTIHLTMAWLDAVTSGLT